MELHGSIIDNLDSATTSAQRFRGHPVYEETLAFWADLLQEGRRVLQQPSCTQSEAIGAAIARLENELAERSL